MKNNNIGRSMVEMLGVLAIIGVLSVLIAKEFRGGIWQIFVNKDEGNQNIYKSRVFGASLSCSIYRLKIVIFSVILAVFV